MSEYIFYGTTDMFGGMSYSGLKNMYKKFRAIRCKNAIKFFPAPNFYLFGNHNVTDDKISYERVAWITENYSKLRSIYNVPDVYIADLLDVIYKIRSMSEFKFIDAKRICKFHGIADYFYDNKICLRR